ncbi:DUF3237 domain-containing protein [Phenylobacterium sp. J367]|uniref:DUF3237 domain-containing protein n=1 Tax=Phenylobacterium sp. J367 TaxID=2898435 RepID=UPI0021509104|nr:DUF3237 domain-containing protein [Phenylobacterium sp. J367]MCR5881130.1 DUF3237 domain-containing protein [Phenylobacterium sp. J367]
MSELDFGGRSLKSEPLCVAAFEVGDIMALGPSPFRNRRVGYVTGGRFEGPRLTGDILPGGGNWPESGTAVDGAALGTFDARSVWRTDDGAVIYVTYTGRSVVPADVGAAFRDPAKPEVDPSRYSIRVAFVFETGDPRYDWLNGLLAVGCGERVEGGVRHYIHAIG